MNIVKQLNRIATANYNSQLSEAQSALESVKANLQMEDQKDIDLLSLFGTKEVARTQTEKVEKIKSMISGKWLNREDIKTVCCKYNLRFLQSKLYKKEIPLKALNDLRRYQEENNIKRFNDTLFVIAPADHFILGAKPKKDPVLIHNCGAHYKIISTWGNDFSFTRRISGFIMNNPNMILYGSMLFAILSAAFGGWLLSGVLDWFLALFAVIIPFLLGAHGVSIDSTEEIWDNPYNRY
jgi:hypothetical protein